MVMPGEQRQLKVELIMPIAMDEGLRFAIPKAGAPSGPAWGNEDFRMKRPRRMNEKIRIRLRAYDHRLLDSRCGRSSTRSAAPVGGVAGPIPLPDAHRTLHREPLAARRQESSREAVRDPHPQASARHPRADAADDRARSATLDLRRRRLDVENHISSNAIGDRTVSGLIGPQARQ